jgi:hypothetical protein
MTRSETNRSTTAEVAEQRSVLFSTLLGLTTLVVLLQGLWAGIFLEHDGKRDAASSWINVHAAGAYVALILALAATIVAVVRLRPRRDLIGGSTALIVLLIIEIGLGQAVHSGTDTLTAVHIPLAMAIMAVAVGLSIRARNHP